MRVLTEETPKIAVGQKDPYDPGPECVPSGNLLSSRHPTAYRTFSHENWWRIVSGTYFKHKRHQNSRSRLH